MHQSIPGTWRGGIRRTETSGSAQEPDPLRHCLTLNLSPISFSAPRFVAGRLPYDGDEAYKVLREHHRETHVLRFDSRTGQIINLGLDTQTPPLGAAVELDTSEHLLLLGKAVQRSLLRWLANRREILRPYRPLQCWGNRKAALLSAAIKELNLIPRAGLEVLVRHSFDTRILQPPGEAPAYLALLLDVSTSNEIDIPVADLMSAGIDIRGRYVCRRSTLEPGDLALPRLEVLGRVAGIERGSLILTEVVAEERVSAGSVLLEPRQENLELVISGLYGRHAGQILRNLQRRRAPYQTAHGKQAEISKTLAGVRERLSLSFGGDLEAKIGPLLQFGDTAFPAAITTSRPSFLFGAQGRQGGSNPDAGITDFGPYRYMQHERNEPVIAVICERRHRGRVDQIAAMLRDGFDEELWKQAISGRGKVRPNPFRGGLVGKFRLRRVQFEFEEIDEVSPDAYGRAIGRILRRLPRPPALGLVQTRAAFAGLAAGNNPYLAAKADFMMAGVPVQAIHIETMETPDANLAYTLNNIALAMYAKLDGTPFVMATRGPATHELVIGLGYSEVGAGRLGPKTRYVGITTVFQGDGRYLVSGQTRDVEFNEYAEALLESLRTTVRAVRDENNWQPGDRVRLVFHVYKPLKHREMASIKALVTELLKEQHKVEYAFLDLSRHHDFQLFDSSQSGVDYYSPGKGRVLKGAGVPTRGLSVQLNERSALLQLVGPKEVKTDFQGLPTPLLIELHPESDFKDLTYLVRQVFHFSYLSWRSFFPSPEPVTILYSRLLANALGNLKLVPGWTSSVLTLGTMRNSKWFL